MCDCASCVRSVRVCARSVRMVNIGYESYDNWHVRQQYIWLTLQYTQRLSLTFNLSIYPSPDRNKETCFKFRRIVPTRFYFSLVSNSRMWFLCACRCGSCSRSFSRARSSATRWAAPRSRVWCSCSRPRSHAPSTSASQRFSRAFGGPHPKRSAASRSSRLQ